MLLYNEDILDIEHQGIKNSFNKEIGANLFKVGNNCFQAYDLHPYDAVVELNYLLDKGYINANQH